MPAAAEQRGGLPTARVAAPTILEAALRIADEVGIDLMLCLFSLDGYDPDAADLDARDASGCRWRLRARAAPD